MSECGHENIRLPPKWIALNLNKRECTNFIPSVTDATVCQCGRRKIDHADFVKYSSARSEKWSPLIHTRTFPTDAYGTILFEGERHPNKAHYARLSYDTNPDQVIHLLRYVWGLPLPKLVISVHGGSLNFDLPARLGKIFQSGIIKTAQSTQAWVLSSGMNTGVSKHLGNALCNRWNGGYKHGPIMSIGIAPWGMCEHRNELIGRNKDRVYSPLEIHTSNNLIHLNPRHSNFLLVDNGSIGRFGGETYLRRKLEKCISTYPICQNGIGRIPMVVIVVEGGGHTLRLISEYLYEEPPVPVILFAGSGRVTDLIAWMIKHFQTENDFQAARQEIISKIEKIFHLFGTTTTSEVFKELKQIFWRKNLITVYNGNAANEEEFDTAILSSVFRCEHWSPLEQLELTMIWDRVDLAQNEVFVYGREWNRAHLEEAMMDALVYNRLEFVELLMEHGLNIKFFLTVNRLEQLYNKPENSKMISVLVELSDIRRISKRRQKTDYQEHYLSLLGVGTALVQMGVYKPDYLQMNSRIIVKDLIGSSSVDKEILQEQRFPQPFDDLFLWAVLTKRHELAKLVWTHGQGALAKSLIASMINKFFAHELAKSNISLVAEFESFREEWNKLSLYLLDSCYRQDFKMTRELLTMELKNWFQENCFTLAVLADHKQFLGHPCCQTLLADLWMGALNLKSNSIFKLFLITIFPPFSFFLQYKSIEELQMFLDSDTDSDDKRNNDQAENETDKRRKRRFFQGNESLRTLDNKSSSSSTNNVLRNRMRGRTTNLAEVASKIDFGRSFPIPKMSNNEPTIGTTTPCEVNGDDKCPMSSSPLLANSMVFETNIDPKFQKSSFLSSATMHKHESGYSHQYRIDPEEKFEKFSKYVTTQQSLKCYQKFIESQTAPVTKFLRYFMGYIVFIFCLAYVTLWNQDPHQIGRVELYVTLFVFTLMLECIREFIAIDALTFSKKMVDVRENTWRLADFLMCIFFLSGTGFRFMKGYFQIGMVIYRAASIYFNLRTYKYLAAHRFIGPKLLMITRMIGYMVYFSTIILVVIFTFAIARESIRSPYTDPTWKDIKPSFLEPYVMMFGQVSSLEDAVDVECIDDFAGQDPNCPLGSWLIPIIWVVYMMISNILIVNVLIAVFNGIYADIDSKSVEIWMSQQFLVLMEFTKKPMLPPPFIVISHVISFLQFLFSKCKRCMCSEELLEKTEEEEQIHIISGNDRKIKAHLTPAEQEIVFDFEEENVDLLRHSLMAEREHTKGAAGLGNAEMAYRVGMASEKSASMQQLKTQMQELYGEMENQRLKIDKLLEYWEMEMANQNEEDGNDVSSSDSSTNT